MIDKDEVKFTPELLRTWKTDAESYVAELVTQDTRLRQLRTIVQELLSAMRVLTAIVGPGQRFDQSFADAMQISWARRILEMEQILFENGFVDEAKTVKRIGDELHFEIHGRIMGQPNNGYLNISAWKNDIVRTLMLDVMRFSAEAYDRYLERETELAERHLAQVKSRGAEVRVTELRLPPERMALHRPVS